jgi:2-iminoacetate synthase
LLGLYDYRFEILAMLMHIEHMEKTYGNDHRTLDEIVKSLLLQGFITSFCATCYRKNRTGEHFMDFAKPGEIKHMYDINALITLKEYL